MWRRVIIGGVVILGIGLILLGMAGITTRGPQPAGKTMAFMAFLGAASEKYYIDNGSYPIGSNAEIALKLRKTHISFDPQFFNKSGELIDEWKHPLRFSFPSGKPPEATSAGKDGIFDTDDDISLPL